MSQYHPECPRWHTIEFEHVKLSCSQLFPKAGRVHAAGGFSLKVVQGRITNISGKGRPNFQMMGKMFIEVCERTANVAYILTHTQREFGMDYTYTVVTAEGLKVKDFWNSSLKFWKVNSRKFYAVSEEDLAAPSRKEVHPGV